MAIGLLLPNQNDQPLAAGDAGVEKVPLQHCVVLRHDRNHHGWIFRASALVDARGVCRYQGVELAKARGDRAPVEAGGEFAFRRARRSSQISLSIQSAMSARRPAPPERQPRMSDDLQDAVTTLLLAAGELSQAALDQDAERDPAPRDHAARKVVEAFRRFEVGAKAIKRPTRITVTLSPR